MNLIAVILVSVIILVIWIFRGTEKHMMYGFWRANAEFCEKADLDLCVLYLGKNAGYIIMKVRGGEIILNSPFSYELSRGYCLRPWMSPRRDFKIKFNWCDKQPCEFFPEHQNLIYWPADGKIILSDEKQVYAILYKDNALTQIGKKAELPKCIPKNNEKDDSDSISDEEI